MKLDIRQMDNMDRVFAELTRAIESVAWLERGPCGHLPDYRYSRCYHYDESKHSHHDLNADLVPALRAGGVAVENFEVGDGDTRTYAYIEQYPNLYVTLVDLGSVVDVKLSLEGEGYWGQKSGPDGAYALVDLGTAARDAAWALLFRAGYRIPDLQRAEQTCARALQPHQYCLELGMSRKGFIELIRRIYFDGPEDYFYALLNRGKPFEYRGEKSLSPNAEFFRSRGRPPLYVLRYEAHPSDEVFVIEDNLAYKFMRFTFGYTPHGAGGTLLVSAAMR
ncbi:hypothetical protein [Calidithermus terrae]|uniref:hypothetical protein n=1 Tax=Calidithermus terrae TaxID=1408545 RepID=UPI0011C4263E|nr:hypothetical protein [Calidithermus terrae]